MLNSIFAALQTLFEKSSSNWTRARKQRSRWATDPLEARTLLATLVSSTKVSYQDADGDNVTLTFSKPILTSAAVANSILTFNFQTVDGSNVNPTRLLGINLTGIAAAAGTTITTAAVRSATTGGDGFATLGEIVATGLDIGNVTIDGDLGRIVAGDNTTTTQGLGALKVHSMGRFGTLTGATNLNTVIQGKLLSLTSKSDIKEAFIDVQGGLDGKLGPVTIGGSLIGGAAANSGRIQSNGDLGAVIVTGDVLGGTGTSSGSILSFAKLASVSIGGSLIGHGTGSGSLRSNQDMGAVTISGDVIGANGTGSGRILTTAKLASVTIGGALLGGGGDDSGSISSTLDMGAVAITGSVTGSEGLRTGRISTSGKLASVSIGGSFDAANDDEATGAIISAGKLGNVTIGGSLLGGEGDRGGLISSSLDMGAIKVTGDVLNLNAFRGASIKSSGKLAGVTIGGSLKNDDFVKGADIYSLLDMGPVVIAGDVTSPNGGLGATVYSGAKMGNVTIGGSLIGNESSQASDRSSGSVVSVGDMGAVIIHGDLVGGQNGVSGFPSGFSGAVHSGGKLASVTINGSIFGGLYNGNGSITSALDMGPVVVKGSVIGGEGRLIVTSYGEVGAGAIYSGGKLASVSIGGSLIGKNGIANKSGFIFAAQELTTLSITGNIRGGSAGDDASLIRSGYVEAQRIGTLTLNGSLIAGTDNTTGTYTNNGAIRVKDDIGSLTIKGSIIGNATNRAIISARGKVTPPATSDLAIGSLTVNGRVDYGRIIAGMDVLGDAKNADAQIGPVIVKGDWIASDLVAGATTGADAFFGNNNDAKMAGAGVKDVATVFSKITSVVIGGQVVGSHPLNTDHYGFVAENIGSFKVKDGNTTFTLVSGNSNDDFSVGIGFLGSPLDTRVNEI